MVVLIHGFSVPSFIWDGTFQALLDAGFGVLRYDLYGRGFSDRPRLIHDRELYLRQLLGLLDELGFSTVDLVGLSMGGPIAAAFTVVHPARVRKLILIDPSGCHPRRLGLMSGIAAVPGLAPALIGLATSGFVADHVLSRFVKSDVVRELLPRYREQFMLRDLADALVSTARHDMLGSFKRVYEELGRLAKPMLLVWGENDKIVPYAQSDALRAWLPTAEFFPVPGSGHLPHCERPQFVNPKILSFLSE